MKREKGVFIGIDAGATKTSVAVLDESARNICRFEGPGTNAVADGSGPAARKLASIIGATARGENIRGIAVGLAGGWSPALARDIRKRLTLLTGAGAIMIVNDAAALLPDCGDSGPALVLNVGTGTVVVGGTRGTRPPAVRVDGWGPLAGDAGSGYWIGQRGLEAALAAYDGRAKRTMLERAIFRKLGLERPAEDIRRLYDSPSRSLIASLAPLVVKASRAGDPTARSIMRLAAAALADSVAAGLRKSPAGRIRLLIAGGLAEAAPELLKDIRAMARRRPRRLFLAKGSPSPALACLRLAVQREDGAPPDNALARLYAKAPARGIPELAGKIETGVPLTERANRETALFSRLAVREQLELLNREDLKVAPAVAKVLPQAAKAVRLIEKQLRRGGRLVYVGAGTSGRLGVLDAAEAPPTFGVPPGLVRGIIAGGMKALFRSVEGAEDSREAGRTAMRRIGISHRDAVLGLSASGGAPFVLGALSLARRRKALCLAIVCNLRSPLRRLASISLEPLVGPEAIAGSTRLKAGTAQKMLLNMISTCTMARLGLVRGNRMINLVPSNRKLRARAVGIVARELCITAAAARAKLIENSWNLAETLRSRPNPS